MMCPMLIFVGGLLGSGRKDFAQHLGAKLDFYVYDLESSMRTSLFLREYRRERVHSYDTLSDTLRLHMFQHVARNFEQLSNIFKNVVVDEPFHRNIPRSFLFEQGKKYFKQVPVVWVEDTQASVEEKALRVLRKNPRHNVANVKKMIEKMESDFEPLPSPPIFARNVAQNPLILDDVVRQLAF